MHFFWGGFWMGGLHLLLFDKRFNRVFWLPFGEHILIYVVFCSIPIGLSRTQFPERVNLPRYDPPQECLSTLVSERLRMWECLAIIPYPPLSSHTKSTATWLHSGWFMEFLVDGQESANRLISHLTSVLICQLVQDFVFLKKIWRNLYIHRWYRYTLLKLKHTHIYIYIYIANTQKWKMTPSFEGGVTFLHYFTNNPSNFWILHSFVEFRVSCV